jgi:hypothetical protein
MSLRTCCDLNGNCTTHSPPGCDPGVELPQGIFNDLPYRSSVEVLLVQKGYGPGGQPQPPELTVWIGADQHDSRRRGDRFETARLGVAAPTAAVGYELDIIAAAMLGGASLFGGKGTVGGVLLGAITMQVLRTGLLLLGFPTYWQATSIGVVIVAAIALDRWRTGRG